MLKSIQKQLTDAEINPKFFNFVVQMAHFWTMSGLGSSSLSGVRTLREPNMLSGSFCSEHRVLRLVRINALAAILRAGPPDFRLRKPPVQA